jgi:hypothetical protein
MLALKRSAIVVRPKLPFLDWLHAADPTSATLTLTDLRREPTIYLVPECGDAEEERAPYRRSSQRSLRTSSVAGGGIGRRGRRPGPLELSVAGSTASFTRRCSTKRTSLSSKNTSKATRTTGYGVSTVFLDTARDSRRAAALDRTNGAATARHRPRPAASDNMPSPTV